MLRQLYVDRSGDVTETWYFDDATGEVHVEHSQDAQAAIDSVSALKSITNSKGEAFWHVARTPVIVAKAWAEHRGIPWEAFVYTNDYDDDWQRMIREQKRLSPTEGRC